MVGVPRSNGCLLCVKRRIKCDQRLPGCVKCDKYGQAYPASPNVRIGRNAEQTGLAWSISNSQDLFLRIVHYSEKNRQHVIFFSPKQERLPGLMEFSTYHRNKIKLTSNKRGERPTLCKMDSAMSIGLSGCELESTRAEPGMRTVKDFNDHIFQIGGMSSTCSVTEDQPYSTKNRTHSVRYSCSCCGASIATLASILC
ncbi:Pc18g05880 [Penicillium rubens Wisconsin 54-1255]|uniref:Pc18g05880 protein n=1 Tax=Penicillium rubens (strain ATCC 28089 / DSM 1075 / NRRL 1951 / Wisconsin 54-1255) TaxID=500485 RepID=B6HCD4_PENRW|nr:Pc18g05880 [Penicillium rubens Wisconsin 54-1255]